MNTFLKILAMMDQLSAEELNAIFCDIKQIIDAKEQPAQKAASNGASFAMNGTREIINSTIDKDETHPTKPK